MKNTQSPALLRALLLRHTKSEVTVQLKDVNGAGKLPEKIQGDHLTTAQKDKLRGKLRDAHIANRAAHKLEMNSSSNEIKVQDQQIDRPGILHTLQHRESRAYSRGPQRKV